MDRRSRSPLKRPEVKRQAASVSRRRRPSFDDGRQVTHAFKEFVAHGANVNCLALGHKSGRVLVTGGDDKKVNLWAVGKPNCILSLVGHTTAVECVQFGGSEELVCAGSLSGALKIWDLEATKIVRTLTGHKANIRCIDFHPYGDFIGTGSLDTNIKLWDIRRKGCIFTYKGHSLTVNSLKFSPDGQWIASAGEDCMVKLWDLRAGKMLTEFGGHTGPVSDVEFHPHEFLLASASHDKTVNFWDLEKFSLVSSTDADTGPIRTIAFHPDGDCLFAGSPDILKVYGWEPARTFDSVAMGWGRIQDVAIAQNQLIGAGFHGVHVSLYVVDLKRVQPFGGPQQDVPSTFRHGAAIRKSFSKDKSYGKANADCIKMEEASDTGGDEPQEDDPPLQIANYQDYNEIFHCRDKIQRTPPRDRRPLMNSSSDSVIPQCMKNMDLPQKDSQGLNYPLNKLPTFDSIRQVEELGPVPLGTPREMLHSKGDPSVSVGNLTQQQSLPAFSGQFGDRRGSSQDVQNSSHKEFSTPISSYSGGQLRTRAVSESRRENGVSHADLDNRCSLHPSPSEPQLAHQDLLLGGQTQESHPSYESPSYSQFSAGLQDVANFASSPGKSAQPDTSPTHSKPLDKPILVRQSQGRMLSGSSGGPESNQTKADPVPPDIYYMGTPKNPDYNSYSPEKMKESNNYLNSFHSFGQKTLNFSDFIPNKLNAVNLSMGSKPGFEITGISGSEMSEQEVVTGMMRGHSSMMSLISARARGLQVAHKLWQTKDLRSAVEHALNTGDQALLVDLLAIISLRPSIWNLDMLTALLPPVSLLLQSKYESYVTCGCNALKLMIKNFAPMIKSNMQGPVHSVGVDISREERYNKCLESYNHMMSIRALLLKRHTVAGKLGHIYRELVILMEAFD